MLPAALHDVWLFVGAALLLNLTPGPDMLLVASTAAERGPRAGVWVALGVGAGCLFHMVLAALGVSALLASSPWAFMGLKALGGGYLVWMGWGLWRAQPVAVAAADPAALPEAVKAQPQPLAPVDGSRRRLFWRGALTNALNPKVALFFLAFLPPFIHTDQPDQTQAFVLLGLLFNLGGTLVNVGVAVLIHRLRRALLGTGTPADGRVAPRARLLRGLQRLAGALFVALGVRLLFSSGPA